MAGVPRVDPLAHRGAGYRALNRFLRTQPGRWFAINLAAPLDPHLLRLTRGRLGFGLMLRSANLVTTGAKSGQPRTSAVLYFTDGEDQILIASSFGRERHPAWYHNLKAHPEATLQSGGRSGRYLASEVQDESERVRLFGLADRVYPGYADYRARTAAFDRRIPILRLHSVSD